MNQNFYDQLTPDNCAMLLIDHQAGLFLGVQSIDQQILKNNAIGLRLVLFPVPMWQIFWLDS